MERNLLARKCCYFAVATIATALPFAGYLFLGHQLVAKRLNSEELYKAFQIFKTHLSEDGPSLFADAIKNHTFRSNSLTVCFLYSLRNDAHFELTVHILVAVNWIGIWGHGVENHRELEAKIICDL